MTKDLTSTFENKQFTDLRDMPGYPYVSDGKSVFYTHENWTQAEQYAQTSGMTPIQETRAGKIISGLDEGKNLEKRFDEHKRQLIWDAASRRYANSVQGQVKTFVAGAAQDSTFRRVELPTILNNRQVTQINGLEREKLDQMRRRQFGRLRGEGVDRREAAARANEAVYRKIAVGEIRQDLNRARNTRNQNLEQYAGRRLQTLREQKRLDIQNRQSAAQGKTTGVSRNFDPQSRNRSLDERYKALAERKYQVKKQQGLSEENARQAAQEHVGHVKGKMALNNERRNLKSQGERLSVQESQAYHQRLETHRNGRIADLQAQAKRQNTAYQGPPAREPGLQKIETNLRADEFAKRTRLEAAGDKGRFSPEESQQRMARLETSFAERRQSALQDYNQSRQPAQDVSRGNTAERQGLSQSQDAKSSPEHSTSSSRELTVDSGRNTNSAQGQSI